MNMIHDPDVVDDRLCFELWCNDGLSLAMPNSYFELVQSSHCLDLDPTSGRVSHARSYFVLSLLVLLLTPFMFARDYTFFNCTCTPLLLSAALT